MAYYDERLQQLQRELARKKRAETELNDLYIQQAELSSKIDELERQKLKEQADVDRLEGRSLAAFFYNVVGKMDERLTKERQEAYAAAVKFDVAAREMEAVRYDIQSRQAELRELGDCEQRYEEALQAKKEAIKVSGIPEAAEILALEEKKAYLESQIREIIEAISAGNSALDVAESILSSLDSAENWGMWDMFGGGGLITHLAKHDHLDGAQAQVEHLQVMLRRFKTELTDVNIQADMQVNIDGFLRFADFFFDGLFADWAVLDRIHEAQIQAEKTVNQIRNVLNKLSGMQASAETEQNRTNTKLEELILKTSV